MQLHHVICILAIVSCGGVLIHEKALLWRQRVGATSAETDEGTETVFASKPGETTPECKYVDYGPGKCRRPNGTEPAREWVHRDFCPAACTRMPGCFAYSKGGDSCILYMEPDLDGGGPGWQKAHCHKKIVPTTTTTATSTTGTTSTITTVLTTTTVRTTTPTPLPTTTTTEEFVDVGQVFLLFTVHNVDYTALNYEVSVRDIFKRALQELVGHLADVNIDDAVEVQLSNGISATNVLIILTPALDAAATTLAQQVSDEPVGPMVAETVREVPGISNSLLGPVSVSAVSVQVVAQGPKRMSAHLVNVKGERFDVVRDGLHDLLAVPAGSGVAAEPRLQMTARVAALGRKTHKKHCSNHAITGISLKGQWLSPLKRLVFSTYPGPFDALKTIGLTVNKRTNISLQEFLSLVPGSMVKVDRLHRQLSQRRKQPTNTLRVRLWLGPTEITVGFAHSQSPSANWLWLEVRGLEHLEGPVGGLLGEDSHVGLLCPGRLQH